MIVYLCRHGIAVDLGFRGIRTDPDRCLSDDGQRKLHEAAKGYRKVIERPRRVITSPYLRARQTALVLIEVFGLEATAEESPLLLPEADPSQALALVQGELLQDAASSPILLVGHEPHLGELLALLLTGAERAAIPLKKGMLAGVEIEDARSMRGQLVLALPQRAGRDLA